MDLWLRSDPWDGGLFSIDVEEFFFGIRLSTKNGAKNSMNQWIIVDLPFEFLQILLVHLTNH